MSESHTSSPFDVGDELEVTFKSRLNGWELLFSREINLIKIVAIKLDEITLGMCFDFNSPPCFPH